MTSPPHACSSAARIARDLPTRSFPVALRLVDKKCLIVGSSAETVKRARALLEAQATVTVVSEYPCDGVIELWKQGQIALYTRALCVEDLAGCWLVVFCDDNEKEALKLGELCTERQIFFCAIDDPAPSSFAHLAIARAGSLFAAIGTSGTAPALASRLRQELQRLFDESRLAQIVERFAKLREDTQPHKRRERLLNEAANISIVGSVVDTRETAPGGSERSEPSLEK